ncbi:hypothetical protein [Demequina mangrovi]|uniref:Uncharacterized protein n=1 Tax=Demequina mangrovi TaxID=1043493 RepID=A0A1H7A058_9MICO|nr:hypothetical protein [Demequina mangrovi]SEJ59069.1 hypothetical protein SAMN05421637_2329 [Demequina mangrovi]
MSGLESMLTAAVDEEAGAASDFAERRGAAVAAGVRRRRRARSAVLGGSAAAAGALVLGVAQLAAPREPVPAASLSCVPAEASTLDFAWAEEMSGGPLFSFRTQDVFAELWDDSLTLDVGFGDVDETLTFAVEDRALVGVETDADGRAEVELASGETLGLGFVWTDERIRIEIETPEGGWSSGESYSDPQMTRPSDPVYWLVDLDALLSDDDEPAERTWTLIDTWTVEPALEMTGAPGDELEVRFPDGSTETVSAGADGVAAFEWLGVTTVSIAADGSTARGDDVTAPLDAIVSGPLICDE